MGHVWCVHLTVRLLRLDWLSVHVSQATTELLMRDPVWPAHVSAPHLTNIKYCSQCCGTFGCIRSGQ